ncbi:lysophospholipid acyltransferase family protein [Streptomyces sp. NPDC050161]|uniref:lysophospholipid acyltransferase family protein n=1 Tax=Streptomyces sp. NPDC050161 TaxID=3365604 RepID=UPI0037A086BC
MSAAEVAGRCAAFARTVRRALADGGRPEAQDGRRGHARALLAALDIRLDFRPDAHPAEAAPARQDGADGAGGPLRVPSGGPGSLIVANHISWLDIPALLAVEPVTLLAKREVGGWPVVGGLARAAGTHFIDRGSPRQLPRVVDELAELLASGRSVAVFPQATTWCTASRGAFRSATFQAAADAGAPVRPVTVDYTQHGVASTVAAFCGDDTFAASLRRVITARGLGVRVTAHPPLLPGHPGTGDRRALAARAQALVQGTAPPGRGLPGPREAAARQPEHPAVPRATAARPGVPARRESGPAGPRTVTGGP